MMGSTTQNNGIAAFVMKTYEMVNDPRSDGLISWGPNNNSFVVSDPLDFSHLILPSFFKHNNFSSFVRQLNTYGFRKVDPDRWEFANEWFLRGQRHLLRNIVRRKLASPAPAIQAAESMPELAAEIERMKEEQRGVEEEMEGMMKRLETTETRPHQMMAFLYKLVDDPDILPRMMSALTHRNHARSLRLRPSSSSSSSSSSSAASASASPPQDLPSVWLISDGGGGGEGTAREEGQFGYFESGSLPPPPVQPPYPFSLLGGGFSF